jgi:hypothetical protein
VNTVIKKALVLILVLSFQMGKKMTAAGQMMAFLTKANC